jgi:hypothetical protein
MSTYVCWQTSPSFLPFLSSYSFHPIGEVKKKLGEILVFFFFFFSPNWWRRIGWKLVFFQLVKKNWMKSRFFFLIVKKNWMKFRFFFLFVKKNWMKFRFFFFLKLDESKIETYKKQTSFNMFTKVQQIKLKFGSFFFPFFFS